MKLITPFLAGVALLAFGSVAQAEEPMVLTDAQLDGVTAGFAFAGGGFFAECASATCDAFGSGSTFVSIFDDNASWFASASSSLGVTVLDGSVFVDTNAFAGVGTP